MADKSSRDPTDTTPSQPSQPRRGLIGRLRKILTLKSKRKTASAPTDYQPSDIQEQPSSSQWKPASASTDNQPSDIQEQPSSSQRKPSENDSIYDQEFGSSPFTQKEYSNHPSVHGKIVRSQSGFLSEKDALRFGSQVGSTVAAKKRITSASSSTQVTQPRDDHSLGILEQPSSSQWGPRGSRKLKFSSQEIGPTFSKQKESSSNPPITSKKMFRSYSGQLSKHIAGSGSKDTEAVKVGPEATIGKVEASEMKPAVSRLSQRSTTESMLQKCLSSPESCSNALLQEDYPSQLQSAGSRKTVYHKSSSDLLKSVTEMGRVEVSNLAGTSSQTETTKPTDLVQGKAKRFKGIRSWFTKKLTSERVQYSALSDPSSPDPVVEARTLTDDVFQP